MAYNTPYRFAVELSAPHIAELMRLAADGTTQDMIDYIESLNLPDDQTDHYVMEICDKGEVAYYHFPEHWTAAWFDPQRG